MHRFFAIIERGEVILTETDAFHLLSVLRVQNNEHIEVVYEGKLFECIVEKTYPLRITVLQEINEVHNLPLDITLFVCMTKKDKPETVIDQATEMGVKEIVLVEANRSVVKLDEDQIIKRLIRYRRVAMSAATQSKRLDVPEITYLPFKNIFDYKPFDYMFIGDANDKAIKVNKKLPQFKRGDRIAIIVGPEGGFTDKELDLAAQKGTISINISSFVLRSEVAAVSFLSIVNYFGNLL